MLPTRSSIDASASKTVEKIEEKHGSGERVDAVCADIEDSHSVSCMRIGLLAQLPQHALFIHKKN